MEGKKHNSIKNKIAELLTKEGYKVEIEYRKGSYMYDIVILEGKKPDIFIEVYTYPPRVKIEQPNIICKNCKYTWHTKSKSGKATCPNCLFKTEVKEYGKNNGGFKF